MYRKIPQYLIGCREFLDCHKAISMAFLVFIPLSVMIYAIGGTLQNYFYSDDYAILYHIQRNTPLGWPYYGEFFAVFGPLYHIFGIQPLGYFAFGIGTYALAIISVYLFFRTLTKSFFIAYMAALIFSTGYIGVAQYNMMIVSITNNLSIVGVDTVLITYLLWLERKRFRYYVVSLGTFFLWLTLFPFRTFTLILFVPTVELFFGFTFHKPFQLKKVIYSFISLLPFYFVGRYSGVFGYGGNGNFGISKIIAYTSPAMLGEYFAILGRLVLPEQLLAVLRFPVVLQTYSYAGGLTALLFVGLSLILLMRNKRNNTGRYVLFVLMMIFEAYAGFFLLLPSFGSGAPTSRYLPVTFIAFSSLLPLLFFSIGDLLSIASDIRYKICSIVAIVGYCLVLMIFSHQYVRNRGKDQGFPATLFYSQIKRIVPIMPDRLTVYIDSANYYPAIPRLGNILPNALFTPEVAFAVHYNVPIDRVTFTTSFDEYVRLFKQNQEPKGKFYSFYYDGKNLRDTTSDVLQSLQSDKTTIVARSIPTAVVPIDKKIVTIDIPDVSSLAKQQLELTMTLSPLDEHQFTYPYFVGSPSAIQKKEIRDFFDYSPINRSAIFSYFIARDRYYKTVVASGSESHHLYPQKLLVDNRLDTWWVDAEHLWELRPKYKQSFVIDLGMVKQINRVQWIPIKGREPSVYHISVSTDDVLWQPMSVRSLNNMYRDMSIISDTFDPTSARYVRYDIKETRNGQTPGIIELEVVEEAYHAIDPVIAWRIGNAPFEYIKNKEELMQTYDYVSKHGVARIFTKTNKEDVLVNQYFASLPVLIDGQTHTYTIPIPTRGTMLESIGIEAAYPMKVSVEEVRIVRQKMLQQKVEP